MRAQATEWAWRQDSLSPSQKLVLLALAYGAQGQQCFPLRSILVAGTGLSEDEVRDAVLALSVKGLIRAEMVDDQRLVFLSMPAAKTKRRAKPKAPTHRASSEDMAEAVRLYNETAARCDLPKVRRVTDAMKGPLSARLSEGGLDQWREALGLIEVSAHLRGLNDHKWKASLGFMLQASSYAKLINGAYGSDYEEVSRGGKRTGPPGRGDQRLDNIRSFDQAVGGRLPERDLGAGGGEDHSGQSRPSRGGEGENSAHLSLGCAART